VAGTRALSCVAEMKVVDSGEPFHVTTVAGTDVAESVPDVNPDPFTVRVKAGLPTGAELGDRLVNVTVPSGPLTEKTSAFEIRVPFCAVMEADPCSAIRFDGTDAVIRFAFTTVVESANPFHRRLVPAANPAPLIVRVNAGPPAAAEDGERLVSVRVGVITKESGAGDVWPGTDTPTETVPDAAIRLAGTAAINCDAETKVVLSGEPFQVTTEPLANPDPLAVRVKAGPPAIAVFGEILVKVTAGCVTVKVTLLEVRLPFCAVSDAEPGCEIRLAGTAASSCAELTAVQTSAVVFQYTTVLLLKPTPFTVRVNAGPPANAEVGEMLVIVRFGVITKESGAGDV